MHKPQKLQIKRCQMPTEIIFDFNSDKLRVEVEPIE